MVIFESLLFLWWLVNFTIINTLGPHLSIAMIIMEVVYALITLWFFAIITMKALKKSSSSIICNPLILIIGFVPLILFLVIGSIALILVAIMHLFSECINCQEKATEQSEEHENWANLGQQTQRELVEPEQVREDVQRQENVLGTRLELLNKYNEMLANGQEEVKGLEQESQETVQDDNQAS